MGTAYPRCYYDGLKDWIGHDGFTLGQRVPDFRLPTSGNAGVLLYRVAGRSTVLIFLGSPLTSEAIDMVRVVRETPGALSDEFVIFFFVLSNPSDISSLSLAPYPQGVRYFMDYGRLAARAYGLCDSSSPSDVRPRMFAMDRNMRILENMDLARGVSSLATIMGDLRHLDSFQKASLNHAPEPGYSANDNDSAWIEFARCGPPRPYITAVQGMRKCPL